MTQKLSIVIPCFNEEESFPFLRQELTSFIATLPRDLGVELVFVDDGSKDNTWSQIEAFGAENHQVVGISLSRNFGHQSALSCGYDMATGDAIVSIDADLQDPLEIVHEMVAAWRSGADVVFAIRKEREGETIFKRLTASGFYRFIRLIGGDYIVADSGDFRLMSRRSLDALRSMREYHKFLRGMVGWIGFKTAKVEFVRKPRMAGVTKYPFKKMIKFALDGTISFSYMPLRMAYVLAVLVGSSVILYLFAMLVRYYFFGGNIVSGWVSLILAQTMFGVANLVCLGILGEYVGRTFEQGKGRPNYIVREHVTKLK